MVANSNPKAKIHAPNFWGFEKFYWDLVKNIPEWMKRQGIELKYAYGCFPGMLWNGGRPQNPARLHDLVSTVEREILGYKKLGIELELTCNNISLLPEDFQDPYCNEILGIWEKHGLTVIVALPQLAQYIKKTYPKIWLKRSCVDWQDNNPGFDYDLLVLDQFEGGNAGLLQSLDAKTRAKTELVANVECIDHCPNFHKHHKVMSDLQRFGRTSEYFTCPLLKKIPLVMPIYHSTKAKHYIQPSSLPKLAKLGFQHFKLVSRCYTGQAIDSVIKYICLPAYKSDLVARAYLCFGVPKRIGEPVDYNFLLGGEKIDDDTRKFLQIW